MVFWVDMMSTIIFVATITLIYASRQWVNYAGPLSIIIVEGSNTFKLAPFTGVMLSMLAMSTGAWVDWTLTTTAAAETRAALRRLGKIRRIKQEKRESTDLGIDLSAPVAVDFKGVSFCYNPCAASALSQLTFHIEPGQLVALTGPVSAGKSTVFACLLQVWRDGINGTLSVGGKLLVHEPVHLLRQQLISYLPQNPFFIHPRAHDNFDVPTLPQEAIDSTLRRLRLWDIMNDTCPKVACLSAGERRLLAFAEIYLVPRRLILLDEPLAEIDEDLQVEVVSMISELAGKATVITATHKIGMLQKYCHQIIPITGQLSDVVSIS